MRKARIDRDGSVYRDKQESLDHVDWLEGNELPIHGIEVVKLGKFKADTTANKTVWYTTQEDVYDFARKFIREQMIGVWNYSEFK